MCEFHTVGSSLRKYIEKLRTGVHYHRIRPPLETCCLRLFERTWILKVLGLPKLFIGARKKLRCVSWILSIVFHEFFCGRYLVVHKILEKDIKQVSTRFTNSHSKTLLFYTVWIPHDFHMARSSRIRARIWSRYSWYWYKRTVSNSLWPDRTHRL